LKAYIKESVQDKFDVVVNHGPRNDRYEVRVVQNSRSIVSCRLGGCGIGVVDDLNCVVEYKVFWDSVVPIGQD
jgi:hypothetical protein